MAQPISKYLGKVYDGMWKVVDCVRTHTDPNIYEFVIENIYNHQKYKISSKSVAKLDKGETTMSKIIHINIVLKRNRKLKGDN